MKTVLFAWEFGSGMGHIAMLERLAEILKQQAIRMVAAVKTPATAKDLVALGIEIHQAPQWPDPANSDPSQQRSSATMGDSLASRGFADEVRLSAQLDEWERLVTMIKPDLMVSDFAPAASLIARGRLPLFIVGNGYTLPPSEMTHFPLLHRLTEPVWEEQRLLTIVNRASRRFGAMALSRLPQLFEGDARLVETFPLLDPHDLQRIEPADGPISKDMPAIGNPEAQDIVVYLARGYEIRRDLIDALLPFARSISIHAPELSSAHCADLAAAGVKIRHLPFSLSSELARARIAIHRGGSGLAAEAIAAGVPQLILASQIEQELNGQALQREGIGKLIRAYDPDEEISPDIIAAALCDDGMRTRAEEAGAYHRDFVRKNDALAKFERECLRLL